MFTKKSFSDSSRPQTGARKPHAVFASGVTRNSTRFGVSVRKGNINRNTSQTRFGSAKPRPGYGSGPSKYSSHPANTGNFRGSYTATPTHSSHTGHGTFTPRAVSSAPARFSSSGTRSTFHGTSRSTSRFGSGAPARSGGFQRRTGRGGGSYGSRGKGRNFGGQSIPVSRYINKAEITEVMEKFVPEHAFADFAVEARLKANIAARGYVTPTPIQDKIIPHILRGADVVGIANTGTGKTAAFLIPLVNKVLLNPKENILIVAPTRELAIQIESELKIFTPTLRIFSTCCVGGAPIGRQISQLRYPNNFIIGTPGRIKDLMERRCINLSNFNTIVLDEADRMLDMGFVNDMKYMMAKMPEKRHTLFFSATLSKEIEALISSFLKDPVRISVKTQDVSKNVDQDIVKIQGRSKVDVLFDLLKQTDFKKVLIFGRTKHGVQRLSELLEQNGFTAESIHGDKPHNRRQKALGLFKENRVQVLVATDVAARGLDIDGISHVINYDLPATFEDYVHRIGRTGRGDKKGKALTFVD